MYATAMSIGARLTIRVRSSRGGSTIQYSTNGRYVSLNTNTLANILQSQPIQPTSTQQAFWGAVIDAVEQDITGHS